MYACLTHISKSSVILTSVSKREWISSEINSPSVEANTLFLQLYRSRGIYMGKTTSLNHCSAKSLEQSFLLFRVKRINLFCNKKKTGEVTSWGLFSHVWSHTEPVYMQSYLHSEIFSYVSPSLWVTHYFHIIILIETISFD